MWSVLPIVNDFTSSSAESPRLAAGFLAAFLAQRLRLGGRLLEAILARRVRAVPAVDRQLILECLAPAFQVLHSD